MPCTRKKRAWLDDDGNLVFNPETSGGLEELRVACGHCPDCRVTQSRDWSIRIMHEAREYEANCFLTLTYDQAHLPEDLSLKKRHWQLFCKKLRRNGYKFRYYHVGEYGEQLGRPHYHAALFGIDFLADRKFLRRENGHDLYVSSAIDSAWGRGQHSIGSLTFDSANYIAKYMNKKERHDRDSERYERRDPVTGEVWRVEPEYATMSRGGTSGEKGIGSRFIDRYLDDVFKDDSVIMNGREYPPPRYYLKRLQEKDPEKYESVTNRRADRGRLLRGGGHQSDLAREAHTLARLNLRKGNL